ncbi:MAG: hypothetical protein ACRDRZ_12935 [Pseudonocardiaceae bacterium]
MRAIAVAALLAGSGLGLVPVAGGQPEQHAAAPQDGVSVLAVTLTAGAASAAVGSGVALSLSRRRERHTQSKVRVTALRHR